MKFKKYSGSINFTCNAEGTGDNYIRLVNPNNPDKFVYFGIQKKSNPGYYTGLLEGKDFNVTDNKSGLLLECGTSGCYAYAGMHAQSNYTAAWIYYKIGKNNLTTTRDIIFKYNNKNVFTVKQDANVVDNNTYVYLREYNYSVDACIVSSSSNYLGIADISIPNQYNDLFLKGTKGYNVYYHVTNNKDISNILGNKTIKQLVTEGIFVYVKGRNFNTNINNVIKAPTRMLQNFSYTSSLTTIDVNEDSIMYLFGGDSDATKDGQVDLIYLNETIDWSNIINDNNETSVGKYRYIGSSSSVTTKTSIIYLASTTISGSYYLFDNSATSTFTDTNINYRLGLSQVDNIDGSSTTHRYLFYYTTDNIIISGNVSDNLSNLTKISGTGNLSSSIYSNCEFTEISRVNVKGLTTMRPISLNDYICIYQKSGNTYTKKDTINFGLNANVNTLGKYQYTYTI